MAQLNTLPRPAFLKEDTITLFEDMTARFVSENITAEALNQWREAGCVDREFWRLAGRTGLLGLSVPEEYGGMGGDFRHEAILTEQVGWVGAEGWDVGVHSAIAAPYITAYGTEDQKRRWLPSISNGDAILAIAMTEPGTGSDLQAVKTRATRDGDHFILNGAKTFISNGQLADLIIVVARTNDAPGGKGLSLIVLEIENAAGFERGRNLHKIGRECADTSELFFSDVKVPVENLLGGEGNGFAMLMDKLPQERLLLALQALAGIEYVLHLTVDYVKQRKAFGKALIDFQNTQFVLADCKSEAAMARAFVERCIEMHCRGELDSPTASMAKSTVTELQGRIVDRCLQLFGGYGYMTEYPIAQAYKDARVTRIYGGTTEIMKLLIARTL